MTRHVDAEVKRGSVPPEHVQDFCSRSRHAKKITTSIYLIFEDYFLSITQRLGEKTIDQQTHLGLLVEPFLEEVNCFFHVHR